MDFRTLLATILLGFFVGLGSTEKVLRYMPTDVKIWSDNVVLNYTFAMDEKVPYINMTFKVLSEMEKVDIHVEGQIVGKKNPSNYMNINGTFSLCNLLAWKNLTPIGMLAFSYLNEFGNLPESCPIPKGEYKLHRIWFPEDPITSSLPEVDFQVNIQAFITTVDGTHVNKMAVNDFWKGEALVTDVPSIKKGLLSFLPKMKVIG